MLQPSCYTEDGAKRLKRVIKGQRRTAKPRSLGTGALSPLDFLSPAVRNFLISEVVSGQGFLLLNLKCPNKYEKKQILTCFRTQAVAGEWLTDGKGADLPQNPDKQGTVSS